MLWEEPEAGHVGKNREESGERLARTLCFSTVVSLLRVNPTLSVRNGEHRYDKEQTQADCDGHQARERERDLARSQEARITATYAHFRRNRSQSGRKAQLQTGQDWAEDGSKRWATQGERDGLANGGCADAKEKCSQWVVPQSPMA